MIETASELRRKSRKPVKLTQKKDNSSDKSSSENTSNKNNKALSESEKVDIFHLLQHKDVEGQNNSIKVIDDIDFNYVFKYLNDSFPIYLHDFEYLYGFVDEFEFKKSPSVDSNFKKYFTDEQGDLDSLREINLEEHTINVVVELMKIIHARKLQNDDIILSIFLALLHDFGKSRKVKDFMGIKTSKKRHDVISSIFILHVADKLNGFSQSQLEFISSTLSKHHASRSPSDKISMPLSLLIEADIAARKKELEELKSE